MTDELGDWGPSLADLAQRRTAARAMGEEERLARHRAAGKLDARARVDCLLDDGSFRELGTLVGDVPGDAFVAGSGTIAGRPVLVGAEDFTVVAGTIGSGSNAKRLRLAELALQERAPLVMMLEGAGFRPTERAHARTMTDLLMQVRCSGMVPVVTAVLGASAGHGALIAPISDFTVMTEGASIFTAGPPVVKDSIGEEVHKLDLGGPSVAVPSGLVHNVAPDDPSALEQVRAYLSYFPQSAWSYPARLDAGDPADPASDRGPRAVPELLTIVPRNSRRTYDMRAVLDTIVDGGRWFEVQAGYGAAIICALAHLGGDPVAIVANQPKVMAGSIDARRGRQGRALHPRRRLVPPAAGVPRRQPGHAPGHPIGARRGAAQRRAHVRRAGAGHDAEAAPHVAQGVRVRIARDGDGALRWPDGLVLVPGRDPRGDGRERVGSRDALRRGRAGRTARGRAPGVVPVGPAPGLRRDHRPA